MIKLKPNNDWTSKHYYSLEEILNDEDAYGVLVLDGPEEYKEKEKQNDHNQQ